MGGFVLRLGGKEHPVTNMSWRQRARAKEFAGLERLLTMKSTNLQHRLSTHMGTRTWSVRDVRRLKEGSAPEHLFPILRLS
jgi:hypothetical protein